MGKLFYAMPCLSTSKNFSKNEIYKVLFDKKVDKRYLEVAIQRFIELNRDVFHFLGVETTVHGTGEDLSISFSTSKYIGTIPIRMPYNGLVRKDFQVNPRFYGRENNYADLTQILNRLNYSISPEYFNRKLCNPTQLKPPEYIEAIKYIDLFDKAYRFSWRKFDTRTLSHSYPKSNTDWCKYSLSCADPRKTLIFPSRDSVLTTNHHEWQKLKYVFEIARGIIFSANTPSTIRYRYCSKVKYLTNKVSNIKPKYTKLIAVSMHDPKCIIQLKAQANAILKTESTECTAWRMDMAEMFERYVQAIVRQAVRGMSGIVYSNSRFRVNNSIPSWGLRYLEPDILIRLGDNLYMADAKYKANYYVQSVDSEILNETHRADLHQILAYCSFEPQTSSKTGILFYPANETSYRIINYSARSLGGITNMVVIFGLAFSFNKMEKACEKVQQMFQKSLID